MKSIITACLVSMITLVFAQPNADEILDKVDKNMSSENRVFESSMTIHGKRNSRTITSKTFSVGDKKSYTEYLSPAREQGTKMLKLVDQLWIYSPSTDRTIQISGHMLRQSVMGSDLSSVGFFFSGYLGIINILKFTIIHHVFVRKVGAHY